MFNIDATPCKNLIKDYNRYITSRYIFQGNLSKKRLRNALNLLLAICLEYKSSTIMSNVEFQ